MSVLAERRPQITHSFRREPVGGRVDTSVIGRARWLVAALAGLVAVGALYGGVRLLVDAEALGAKESWLEGTPFPDYRVPGVVLLVVIGGGMLATASAALRQSRFGGLAALAGGAALVVWGAVETLTIGYQGAGQLVLLGLFVVGPALPLIKIGLRATFERRLRSCTRERQGVSPAVLAGAPLRSTPGMTSRRSTRVSRVIRAPRERVYSALVDANEVPRWRFPTGMSIAVDQFEPREGGRVRVSLTYASSGVGKTDDRTDTYRGRFVELVPNERVVEIDEFETDDPSLQGEMRMTISLEDVSGGTEVVGLHEGIPAGVALADNEAGWRSALSRLSALVER